MSPILVLLAFFVALANSLDFYDGLENSRVQVATYLTTPTTKIIVSTEVKNTGDKPADSYIIAIPQNLFQNLSALEAVDDKTDEHLRTTRVDKLKFAKKFKSDSPTDGAVYFSIPLPKTLIPGQDETVKLKITIAYVHLLSPLPAEIKKSGKQYVIYENNRYFYSPYVSKKMGVKFTLASDKIKSYTKPATVKDKKLTYGPYSDLNPLAVSNVKFHYQFHTPFLTMTEVTRDMEVSHWGNVRIEETFFLRHDGAKLKGPYEPGVIDRRFSSGDPSVVTDLKATLPKSAHGCYLVDRIGNVSTSHFRSGANSRSAKASYLEMRPRYPLYGGWKTDFTIGYDVPSQDLISFDPRTSEHVLNISFGIPFREPVTNELITTIALPEGASDIQVECPYDIEIISNGEDRRFTYLDTRIGGGRPLIQFTRKNVVSLHNKFFQVRYKYDKNAIYFKPILIVSGIFVFLFTVMIFRRINPTLDVEEEEALRQESLLEHAPQITHVGKKALKTNGSGSSNTLSGLGSDDVKKLLNDIDVSAQANLMYKQLKRAREGVKNGNDDVLKQRVNEAYNKAKKSREDKKRLTKIIDDLKQSI